MRRRYPVSIIILLLAALLLTGCSGRTTAKTASSQQKITIVTSFYPIFIHTINITRDIPGVEVINMTQPQTGCLHDYQLTPDNIKLLESAEFFVINGAGMESFMDKVVEQLPGLKVVEASRDVEMISEGSHAHEGDSHEDKNSTGDSSNASKEAGTPNPHVWVSISGAVSQVENIASGLSEYDPKHSAEYERNAKDYIIKLEAQKEKMHEAMKSITNRNIVTFHEAFPYFAKEFDLNVIAVIEREPGSEPGAGELAKTVGKIRESGVKALFAEPQYSPKAADTIARETGARVYYLDPVVTGTTGDKDYDAYLKAMDSNLKVLLEALK